MMHTPSLAALVVLVLSVGALAQPAAPPVPAPPKHPVHKPTPVVQPPAHGHAEKPGTHTAAAKAVTKPPVAEPAPVAPAPPAAPAVDPAKGSVTGLKLPRWVSLRTDDVNLRAGPGMRYPIEWQYHRRDLPVRIERELEVWRLIEDQDGVKGWVHQATLTARRSFVVKDTEQTLRETAADDAAPVARLKPGVIGHIRACDPAAAWCDVQVGDYHGWLKRTAIWGTDPGESVN